MFTRLILVRHGETAWNVAGRYQGHLDSPLTEAGLAQNRALAARIAHEHVAALYSSDLERALQSARFIAQATRLAIQPDARLRERHLGVFQGLTRDEVKARFPDAYRQFKTGGPDYVVPEGESARQSAGRMVACLEELAGRHPGETIAVVTHGGALGAFLRRVLGLSLDAPRRYERLNASWNVFSRQDGSWYLETWGDLSHLGELATRDDL